MIEYVELVNEVALVCFKIQQAEKERRTNETP